MNLNQNVLSHSSQTSEIPFKKFILESVFHLSPSVYQILSLETFICLPPPQGALHSSLCTQISPKKFLFFFLLFTAVFHWDIFLRSEEMRRSIAMRIGLPLSGHRVL